MYLKWNQNHKSMEILVLIFHRVIDWNGITTNQENVLASNVKRERGEERLRERTREKDNLYSFQNKGVRVRERNLTEWILGDKQQGACN